MATYTVNARSGLDTNPGTNAQPFKTLERAITAVTAAAGGAVGDTIVLEGDGNVYTPPVSSGSALISSSIQAKKGVQIIGTGSNSRPVIEGGGLIDIAMDFKSGAANSSLVKNVEVRNFRVAGIRINATQGLDTNFLAESCEIHHIIDTRFFGPPDPTARYQDGINISFGNPTIRNCEIHHIGQGGEAHGIYLSTCHNHVLDGNDIYAVRKEGIRDALGLRGSHTNNRFWRCTSGIHFAQCVGGLIANNTSYLNHQFGLSAKHNNDPLAALPTWGLSQGEVVHFWHNTVFSTTDESLYVAGNLTNGLAKPAGQIGNAPPNTTNQTGRSWLVEYRNNLFSGFGQRYIWDDPYVRDDTVNLDHNVYESRAGKRPLHFYTRIPDGLNIETIEEVRANTETLGWETNGRMLAVNFVDEVGGDFTPSAPIPGTLELPSQWGSQVGARASAKPRQMWKPNAAIVLNSSTDKPTQWPRLVDDLGSNTTLDTTTNTDEWFTIDHGSIVTFDHFHWVVFGHQKQSSTLTWSMEISNDNVNWTTIVDHQKFNDHFGSDFIWDLGHSYSARYLRWTSHDNFIGYGISTPAAAWLTWGGVKTATLRPVGSTPPATAVPSNTDLPAITGTAQTGSTLTSTTGAWLNAPTSYAYQWRRGTTNISGATTRTYVLIAADEGQAITCRVTATNSFGSTAATSEAVTPSAAPPTGAAPANTVLPQITTDGLAQTGDTVSATTGTWANSPTSFTYQWKRAGTNITGATGSTYVFVTADEGKQVTVLVTAANAFGSATALSSSITPQAAPPPPPPNLPNLGAWGVHT